MVLAWNIFLKWKNQPMKMRPIQLHCLSNFSFLRAASHPSELVQQALYLDYQALAITDECSLAGIVRAYTEAREHKAYHHGNFKLLIGSEFHTSEGFHLVVLTPNRTAYSQLCYLITQARKRADKGSYQVSIMDFKKILKDCLFIWKPKALTTTQQKHLEVLKDFFNAYRKQSWLGYEHQFSGMAVRHRQQIEALSRNLDLGIVACPVAFFHKPEKKPLFDLVNAIRLGITVDDLGTHFCAHQEQHLQNINTWQQFYKKEELLACEHIAKRCHFKLEELKYQYPKELVPPHLTSTEYLRLLVEQGIVERWPEGIEAELRATIEKELALIKKLKYEYYFLSVYEIVHFARSKDILCQGRGSAANSVVCYCLGITSVSPKEINVLFERFISEERDEPPDIDVDFEHERREEVIQHIYQKYGRHRAALTATLITYRHKSAVRETGKALGFDQSTIDFFSKSLAWWDQEKQLRKSIEQAGFSMESHKLQCFFYLVKQLLGFPRHLSQHVGGFVICENALDQIVPVENASMADRTVIQWDKLDIEALGLLKIDVLGLGMLSAIRKSLHLIQDVHGKTYSLASIPREDPKVYEMLQAGDSVGVFQVESRAQMSMLPRLRPACFYDLVVQVAIVRPGPIQGKMVHPYLKRRQGLEKESYPSEALKVVLKRTLGVPIFQEQAISIAMVAGGFSAGEADALRRAIANWGRDSKLGNFKERLLDGMRERGYSEEFSENIWQQIMGFAGYGFPESHAASFALLVYASSWLKRYHPAIFCCGLLNSLPMGFYSPSQLIQDIKRHDVEVLPIDILFSEWDHSIEIKNETPCLRLGFRLIKGLDKKRTLHFCKQKKERKNQIKKVEQLSYGFHLRKHELSLIANAGALETLTGHRFQSRWQVNHIEESIPLLGQQEYEKDFPRHIGEPSVAENVMEDYRHTHLSLRPHPIALLRNHPELKGCKHFEQLREINHGRFVRVAGLVTGRQRPGSARGIIFLTLEDEFGNNNIICWKNLVDRQRDIILKAQAILVKGIVEREKNVVHIVAGQLEDISHLVRELEFHSRDFQ